MNKKQRAVLIAITVVIVGMLLYPPFHWRGPKGQVGSAGYSWIFDPPPDGLGILATVDLGLLVIQWLGVLIVGGITWIILKDRFSV
jgi:hypothetical protein